MLSHRLFHVPDAVDTVGYLAMLVGMGSLVLKQRGRLLFVRGCADTIFMMHYAYLGASAGALVSLLYAISEFFGIRVRAPAREMPRRLLFIALALVLTTVTYEVPMDALPALGAIFSIAAAGIANNVHMRLVLVFGVNPVWFLYGYMEGSTPCMLSQILYTMCTLIGLYRALRRPEATPCTLLQAG